MYVLGTVTGSRRATAARAGAAVVRVTPRVGLRTGCRVQRSRRRSWTTDDVQWVGIPVVAVVQWIRLLIQLRLAFAAVVTESIKAFHLGSS